MKLKIFQFFLFFSLGVLISIAVGCSKNETGAGTPQDPVPPDTTQNETPFANVPGISDITMYEINERAFSVPGNLAGILPRLDSIRALGVNVIWLMPVHPIGVINTVNSPYCIRNYEEVNPEYGTLDDLKTLVKEAHNRNMAVILDWAANHTSWDNPWIQHKAWYTQDGNGNIIHPAGTNWLDVADLNFDNAEMRLEMIKCLKYWITTANIDGYRCDAADFVPYAFWKQAIDSIRKLPGRKIIMLAEGARADHFTAGFDINFGWDFFNKNKNVFRNNQPASGYYQTHLGEYTAIPAGSQKLRFTSNHDVCAWDDTPIGLFGGMNGSMSAFVISAFMGGVPLIYNGQEVGCAVKLPFFSRSPINWTINPGIFREYKRLMGLRAAHPALRTGDLISWSDNDVAAFKRKASADEVLVVANTRNAAKTFNVPAALNNTTWQNTSTGATVTLGNQLSLNVFEYLVLTR
jgi:alpha-amylase